MNKKHLLAIALTLIAGTGLGSWLTTRAAAPIAQATAHADHGEESVTDGEQHAENDAEEEGHLKLSAEQISAAGIQLAQAGPLAMDLSLPFPGEVRFDEDRTAHVVPRTSGVVEQVLVNLGQPVKKGQLLAVIASQQISDQRSEQAAAQRRVELARTTFERERQLWQEQISAEQDLLQARQALQEAEIALNNARQKVSVLSGNSTATGGNRYELRAPFDSVVVEKHLTLGEVVNDSTSVLTLSDLSKVWVTFGVSPKDLESVQVGKTVSISAAELDAQVTGKVSYVGSLLGEQTRTATVRVSLENPQGAWRPGLFVTARVTVDSRQTAVAVPESAIQTVEDTPNVFVRTDDGFKAQSVQLGRRAASQVEIVQGLDAGAQVATAGSFILKSELGKASAEHAH